MDEDLKVTITLDKYNELLSVETRTKVLIDTVNASKYSIDREEIATILGFELKNTGGKIK